MVLTLLQFTKVSHRSDEAVLDSQVDATLPNNHIIFLNDYIFLVEK